MTRRHLVALIAAAAAATAGAAAADAYSTRTASTTWHTESYVGSPNLFWVNGGTLDLTATKTAASQAAFTLTVSADVSMLQDRRPSEQPVREDVYACGSAGCTLQGSHRVTLKYPGNVTRFRYQDSWKDTIRTAGATTLTSMQVK